MRGSLFICLVFVVSGLAKDQGDTCTDHSGQTGTCQSIMKCNAALQALRRHIQPYICGFSGDVPIVCCAQGQSPIHPGTRHPTTVRTTTEYTPTEEDYQDLTPSNECKPIRNFTAAPTDRISWKKCLQYQEELVYPCKVDPLGAKIRVRNCRHSVNQLIVGGVDAAETEFPHMVMLSYNDDIADFEAGAGGTLLSDWFILTAGHCTYKKNQGYVKYAATSVLKTSNISPSRVYKIAERIQYKDYVPNYHYFDIALLKTESRIKLDMFAVPACLDLANDVSDDQALATGWGAISYKGDVVDTLQKVVLQKFPNEECSQHFTRGKDRRLPSGFQKSIQMCFGDKTESKDACGGDSGGPLQIKLQRVECMYSVIGVTSFGKGCGVIGKPGVYTRVLPFVDWIESVVWPGE